jgi:hypothetical protein
MQYFTVNIEQEYNIVTQLYASYQPASDRKYMALS